MPLPPQLLPSRTPSAHQQSPQRSWFLTGATLPAATQFTEDGGVAPPGGSREPAAEPLAGARSKEAREVPAAVAGKELRAARSVLGL